MDRSLGLTQHDDPVVCYAVAPEGTRRDTELAAVRLDRLASVRHQHILPIINVELEPSGTVFLTAPYTGNQEGLVTLADLIAIKGGQMSPFEVARAASQLLEASSAAHEAGVFHGPIDPASVLVDPHGSLFIELYGIRRFVAGLDCTSPSLARDEVTSIASIAYAMLTGADAAEPRVRASRLVRRLDRAWDQWFDDALDPSAGFDSALDAIAALPGNASVETRPARSSGVLTRLRRAVASDAPRRG